MTMWRIDWRLRAAAAATALLVAMPFITESTGLSAQGGQAQGQAQGQAGRGGGRGGVRPGPGQGGPGGRGQAPRDAQQQQTPQGTGAITGTVTIEGSNTPVRRARLNLTGAELRGRNISATTDDRGNYIFQNLPAGRFNLNASKPAFVTIAYGAKKPGRPGTAIQLAEGQKLDRV